jgi:NADH:ubiquinone oxidoreductase subunit F (NADH-binding)/NADH:ubiquinone oxidoreductase subunit E
MSRNLVALQGRSAGPDRRESPIALLRAAIADHGRITEDDLRAVAAATGMSQAAVHGVATYYADLGLAQRGRTRVKVCRGTACFAACKGESAAWLEKGLGLRSGETSADGAVSLEHAYCLGFCHAAPAAMVGDAVHTGLDARSGEALGAAARTGAQPEHVEAALVPSPIIEAHGPAVVLGRVAGGAEARALGAARAQGAYSALAQVLGSRSPAEVVADVCASELRGRGGAGFPTGTKWRLVAEHAARAGAAHVVANADEGDPGSYIDKVLLERDPHAVLEGLAIAAFAVGASTGFIYVRSEYPAALPVLESAVREARRAGILGDRVLGSGFRFDVEVVQGAGSYVCGEETALLRSLEGLRGTVTARPPYPAERGLFGTPTAVNNVETLACIPWIVRHGGAAYRALGHGSSRGTKCVSLNERFARPGVYEVPLGMPLAQIVELGGGMANGRRLKALQIGGPLGGILPAALLATRLGFDELAAVGALLGHGGIVAFDDETDARDIAVHLLELCDAESCGKCFPCRIGSRRGLEIARRLRAGMPRSEAEGAVGQLAELCETMKYGSLCAFGGGIASPIESLLTHFREEMIGAVQP